MKYVVKKEDIRGDIAGYPIEIIQAAVDRAVEQRGDANGVIRSLQVTRGGGFWRQVMYEHKFYIFFQRYPREFADGVHYFVIDKGRNYWIDVAKTFLGKHPRFAFEGCNGDIFYIAKNGSITKTGFALRDSPRYRRVIENGIEIKY